MVPSAPAILNAIAHATGRRVHDLPANLERILMGKDLVQGWVGQSVQAGAEDRLTLVGGTGLCFGTFLLVPGALQVPGTFFGFSWRFGLDQLFSVWHSRPR